MNISKSFIYVYKSNSYKSNIKNHLRCKFSRYNFLFKNIRTIEATKFENFLDNPLTPGSFFYEYFLKSKYIYNPFAAKAFDEAD